MTPTSTKRLPRATLLMEVAIIVLACVWVLAGLPLYVFPSSPQVNRADVIFVIGPPTPVRIHMAKQLRAEGVSDRILISVERKGKYSADKLTICAEPSVTCEVPDPTTTNGEARMLRNYSAAKGTRTAVVLTFTPHVARSRYIFSKCYGPGVTVLAVHQKLPIPVWGYQYAYQTAAFVKAWIIPCA